MENDYLFAGISMRDTDVERLAGDNTWALTVNEGWHHETLQIIDEVAPMPTENQLHNLLKQLYGGSSTTNRPKPLTQDAAY